MHPSFYRISSYCFLLVAAGPGLAASILPPGLHDLDTRYVSPNGNLVGGQIHPAHLSEAPPVAFRHSKRAGTDVPASTPSLTADQIESHDALKGLMTDYTRYLVAMNEHPGVIRTNDEILRAHDLSDPHSTSGDKSIAETAGTNLRLRGELAEAKKNIYDVIPKIRELVGTVAKDNTPEGKDLIERVKVLPWAIVPPTIEPEMTRIEQLIQEGAKFAK